MWPQGSWFSTLCGARLDSARLCRCGRISANSHKQKRLCRVSDSLTGLDPNKHIHDSRAQLSIARFTYCFHSQPTSCIYLLGILKSRPTRSPQDSRALSNNYTEHTDNHCCMVWWRKNLVFKEMRSLNTETADTESMPKDNTFRDICVP